MRLLHRHKQDCKLETTATNLAKDALEIAACQCFAYQATVFAGNYLGKASKNKYTWDLVASAPLSVGKAALGMALGGREASAVRAVGCSGEKPPTRSCGVRGAVLTAGGSRGLRIPPPSGALSAHPYASHPSISSGSSHLHFPSCTAVILPRLPSSHSRNQPTSSSDRFWLPS